MGIGDRIKALRLAKKMTQKQLAKGVGCSPQAVSQWETGDTKGLRAETLIGLAKTLKEDPGWLLTGRQPGGAPAGIAESPADYAAMQTPLETEIIEALEPVSESAKRALLDFLLEIHKHKDDTA